jgi:hypothetical protein
MIVYTLTQRDFRAAQLELLALPNENVCKEAGNSMDTGASGDQQPELKTQTSDMDAITRAFYELTFKVAFLEKKADEFQDFFSSVMEKRYPADFIRVRPWGNTGDRKNDGYLRSKRFLFQSYAPNQMKAAETIAKIDEDFNEALPYWKDYFRTWIFVHNSKDGLGPDVTRKLLELDMVHKDIRVTSWGFEELRHETFQLNQADLASLLGNAPSHQGMVNLGLSELAPILDQIEMLSATADPDLRPIPADKVEGNLLSDHVAILLKAGMSRADLVGKFFLSQPSKRDRIAETFQSYYQNLRKMGFAPDQIFSELQRFAGGDAVPSPSRQNGVLAILAYFFETCDIFERPGKGALSK